MDKTRLSMDSLGESEIERLKDSLKLKETIIADKSQIIKSLRQQVTDLHEELSGAEKNEQVLHQKIDRLSKEKQQRDEDLEAVSHTLKEVDTAYENLRARYEARAEQVKELFEDLKKTKKELERLQSQNEEIEQKNERLTVELEMANSKKRQWLEENQENQPTRANFRPQMKPVLHFTMADELGEIMDSTALPPIASPPRAVDSPVVSIAREREQTVVQPQRGHQTRYVQSPDIDLESQIRVEENQNRVASQEQQYCPKHQAKIIEEQKVLDPIEEYKMRVARANELARRNKLTKPLHQTSYALELDTFDTIGLSEHEIKRGNVAKRAAAAVSEAGHKYHHQHPTSLASKSRNQHSEVHSQQQNQYQSRQVLMNRVNTTPVARRVYKKAEAFII